MAVTQVREALFEQLARVGKALSSPKRLELLEVLAQGERSVESLAEATGMPVGNTSAHLQALRGARLVRTRRVGTRVFYSLPDEQVTAFMRDLWKLADARLAEVEQLIRDFLHNERDFERVTREQLLARSMVGEVTVLDVRPPEEFEAGHVPGAVNIPLEQLGERLDTLPRDVDVVAYCRGPYCLLAPRAAQILREHGWRASVLEDGLPEWRAAGLPVAAGTH